MEAYHKLQRSRFWSEVDAPYKRLRADPDAWAACMDEIPEWDVAMLDVMENEPPYFESGRE